jgi:plastocyanin
MPVCARKRGWGGGFAKSGGAIGLLLALAALFAVTPTAHADTTTVQAGTSCPPIANKPGSIPHVDYNGVKHLTYCAGPVKVNAGQNVIRLNGTDLFPKQPGYITRFDPELVYTNGTVPRVDVLHLHHAVWVVNGNPQFAVGEEKTIIQAPKGFGWRTRPSDNWLLNDMLHDLVAQPAKVYIVWRVDFVPDTAPAAANMKTVRTRWMDVSGPQPRAGVSSPIYPVFNSLRRYGANGKYTFPDQAPPDQRQFIGPNQTWVPDHPVTLLQTAGHLHPGGLSTRLTVQRGAQKNSLFTSKAHYYEPAGEVSWDVAMGATPPNWRVKLKSGDKLGVHAIYDTKRADWYEVMGIMPVAVYDGTNVGGVDAMSTQIPQEGVLTHGHLAENRHHGGGPTSMPNPLALPDGPFPSSPVSISGYLYSQGDLHQSGAAGRPPTIHAGQQVAFKNLDDAQSGTWHTITGCKEPCNRDTGIAYPIANGPRTFDSGQLGTDPPFGGPAVGRITWKTPKNLSAGTYAYFCRVHPFMRGSFRVKP